jgi:hypothetical protein
MLIESLFVLTGLTYVKNIRLKLLQVPRIGETVTFFDVVYEVLGINWHFEDGTPIIATIYANKG